MTRKSLGGILVDLECRVLNQERRPIANLYAVGEVTGFNGLNGKAGLEGTFLGPSILKGRILGRNLANRIHDRAALVTPITVPMTRSAPETAASGGRCQSCHAELSPFAAKQYQTNPQSQNCRMYEMSFGWT